MCLCVLAAGAMEVDSTVPDSRDVLAVEDVLRLGEVRV